MMRCVRILAAAAAVTIVQACSAAVPQPGLQPIKTSDSMQQSIRSSAGTLPQAVYVANTLTNTVDVFDADGTLDTTITDGLNSPAGLFLDGNQDLWVANNTNILMFPKGTIHAARTLRDPGGSPADVCVAKNGTVYVSNFFNGSVSIYAPGSDTPTTVLTVPRAQYVVGVANDAAGNLFVTYNDATGVGRLDEFVGATQKGYKPLPPRFSFAADIKIDNAGNLLVLDEEQFSVTEYAKNGHPTGLTFPTFYQWNAFDVSRDGNYIAGTDSLPDHDRAVLKTFPSGHQIGLYSNHYNGGISGVALAPGHFQ